MEKSSARWWDLPSAIYLFLAILFSAWRLESTSWADELGRVRNVALLGLVVGLALGQSIYQRRGLILLATGYMLVFFTWQWLGMIEFGKEEFELGERLIILIGRLFLGLSEFAAGRPVKDGLFFVAILCIPYWFAALISGYQLTRHANALAAILPNGILMFVIFLIHYSTHDYSWFFGAYIFVALLLVGRQKYLMDRIAWREQRVKVSAESGMDFNNIIMASAAILIILAWTLPTNLSFNEQARETWKSISTKWFGKNEQLENIFAAAKKESIPTSDFFRNELSLGLEATQSAEIAFLVYVPSSAQNLPRLYWRGRVYDHFENGQWQTTNILGANYKPQDGNFKVFDVENRINANFTFNVIKEQSLIYSAAQPLSVNHVGKIAYSTVPTQKTDDPLKVMDIIAIQSSPYLRAGETYQASALIANPIIPDLREAGDEYPAWVTNRYLQLPSNFSVRIQSLAFEITANSDNPYDKAVAITNYLRSEIKYKPSISFPPGTTDPLEYFLFDLKQGFCNYYASAETLMLRSIGIPARLAVGFAQGEANLDNAFYTVRERDAHAWPEVYFPNYGWIEFEPTGNQDPLERPKEQKESPPEISGQTNPPRVKPIMQLEPETPSFPDRQQVFFTRARINNISMTAGGIILVLLIIFLQRRYAPNIQAALILKSVVDRYGWESPAWLNRWVRWTELTPIEKSFQSINTGLRWLGNPQPVHVTPSERAKILMELLPAAAADIEILLREHQSALFTRNGGDEKLTRRAARNIRYQILYIRLKIFILGYNYETSQK
jgi:transglutaminase-like putative cysteine protease